METTKEVIVATHKFRIKTLQNAFTKKTFMIVEFDKDGQTYLLGGDSTRTSCTGKLFDLDRHSSLFHFYNHADCMESIKAYLSVLYEKADHLEVVAVKDVTMEVQLGKGANQ